MGDAAGRPPTDEITTDFEHLREPTAADHGRPVCRGTHRHGDATVERTYHREEVSRLTAETTYIEGEETVDVRTQCWLLEDGRLRHTGEDIVPFCRAHHYSDPATDLAGCHGDSSPREDPSSVTSTFQPATSVVVENGAALRFTGVHESEAARVQRRFFVDETGGQLRIETVFHDGDTRLGSVTERQALLPDGEFVAATGEPIDAFCRRTHLSDPAADLRYCRARREDGPP